ncbi:single-stranded-DNA-specific exonuclease RecJ [Ampullimonas aquatilis]|uniref:single-stranded-DNA-specific exonuclease RecJ n=1 Tax=Ampullimonas aquatilis TaxID=1341549 RepID=UPI003C75F9FB
MSNPDHSHTLLIQRQPAPKVVEQLMRDGLHPLLARIVAARGVQRASELTDTLEHLIPPSQLTNADIAARFLADAIAAGKQLLIIADYDCDGATACAVGLRGLKALGANVNFLVPNRFEYGYGLTPEIVTLAAAQQPRPDILVTVDNGIASVAGVAAANELGLQVLVTDHHLPGDTLPAAAVIVNPNQPGCQFPSKALAGVGVMFYVLLALRSELRERGVFTAQNQPRLDSLLDLVALGTVADVVKLDANNRLLVAQGLKRMRAGRMQAGVAALFRAAARDASRASSFDLGFGLGPRLNAAGRLADMALGIECLTTDEPGRAWEIAAELDRMNRERRDIEAGMQAEALAQFDLQPLAEQHTLTVYNPTWHQGVIGIVASRLKEKFHRPTITFAPGAETEYGQEIKGSGRSISGFHLRDALDLVSKRQPDLILKFGGHAMAAGLSLRADDFERFQTAFETVAQELLDATALQRRVETDGSIEPAYLKPELVELLDEQVWGQGFAAPTFSDAFIVLNQRILKDKHLKVTLVRANAPPTQLTAICFNRAEFLPEHCTLAYRVVNNSFNGVTKVELMIEHVFD